ncbi:MAG: 30S ribosomal protein S3 [Gammaproteobacteria bacterium]|nr:30S ribosomal protein S3 [Gammaproteobacteria bacterium]
MGQKVHPTGMRLGISTEWTSKWYAEGRNYAELLSSDLEIRDYLRKKLSQASVSRIQINRPARAAFITIHTARPGIVIGKKGEDIEALRREIARRTELSINNVKINIEEIRKPEIDAQLVAESISQQLERRIMFRRAMKRAVSNAMRLGALGVKVRVAGRLNGAEIARSEWYREGRVPLHTLKAVIDYGFAEAKTTYGIIGVKTWIYKGDVYDLQAKAEEESAEQPKGRAKKRENKS